MKNLNNVPKFVPILLALFIFFPCMGQANAASHARSHQPKHHNRRAPQQRCQPPAPPERPLPPLPPERPLPPPYPRPYYPHHPYYPVGPVYPVGPIQPVGPIHPVGPIPFPIGAPAPNADMEE